MTPERLVRYLQIVFILMWLMFACSIFLIHPEGQSIGVLGECLVVLFAIESARVGFKLQRMMLRVRSESLPRNTESTPISRWIAGNVLRLATGSAVCWGGIFIRIMGGSVALICLLFASSLLLLLFWQPGEVPAANESQSPTR
jgi:hypothetical protein